jgi:hypothetical protein
MKSIIDKTSSTMEYLDSKATPENLKTIGGKIIKESVQVGSKIVLTLGVAAIAPELATSVLTTVGIGVCASMTKDLVVNCLYNNKVTMRDVKNAGRKGAVTYTLVKVVESIVKVKFENIINSKECITSAAESIMSSVELAEADVYSENFSYLVNILKDFYITLAVNISKEVLKDFLIKCPIKREITIKSIVNSKEKDVMIYFGEKVLGSAIDIACGNVERLLTLKPSSDNPGIIEDLGIAPLANFTTSSTMEITKEVSKDIWIKGVLKEKYTIQDVVNTSGGDVIIYFGEKILDGAIEAASGAAKKNMMPKPPKLPKCDEISSKLTDIVIEIEHGAMI